MRTLSNAVPKKLHHISTHDEETQLDLSAPATVAIARRLSIPTTPLPTNISPAESEAKALHPSPPSFSRPRAEGASDPRGDIEVHEEEQHVTKQLPRLWHQGPGLKETCLPLPANKSKTSWIPETGRGVPSPGLLTGANQEGSSAKGALPSPPQQTRTLPIPCQEKVSQPGSLGVYNKLRGFPNSIPLTGVFFQRPPSPGGRGSRPPSPRGGPIRRNPSPR